MKKLGEPLSEEWADSDLMLRFEEETGILSTRWITDGVHCIGIEVWHYEYIKWLCNLARRVR